jgi:tetratricopeptide (TPR) repeat protein
MEKLFEKIEQILIYSGLVLIPFIVLPIFPNPYLETKLILLCSYATLLVINGSLRIIFSGRLKLNHSPFDIGIIILAFAYLISTIIGTPGKMDAFVNPGTATLVLASTIYYFFIKYHLAKKEYLKLYLFVGGILISSVSLLATAGILGKIDKLPAYIRSVSFNTEGQSIFTAIYLLIMALLGISLLIKQRAMIQRIFLSVCLAIVLFGLTVNTLNALPGKADFAKLPDLNTSWQVTFEALKQKPVFGLGSGNYSNIFNKYKPLSFNSTPYWNLSFSTASSYYLTLVAETGFAGLLGLILIWGTTFSLARKHYRSQSLKMALENIGEIEALIILSLALLIFPASFSLIFLFVVLLAINSPESVRNINLVQSTEGENILSKLPSFLISIPLILVFAAFGFFTGRTFLAEATFAKALEKISNTQDSYNLMVKAIKLNPYVDTYHFFFSQFNMALVNNISQSKTELTDEQRTLLAQLLQQSISEGKAAVTSNKFKATNWENLGKIYQIITPFVQGADQYAIGTYSQAISLDPINPNLRISLGGVYYALGRYDEAIKSFELATYAKADLANAYYNLAIALRDKGDIQKAITQIKIVMSLVDKDSNDYAIAKAELEALEKKVPVQDTPQGESLNAPEAAQEPIITPPIELPAETPIPTP